VGDCIIRVRMDLLLRLIDTTTGISVDEVNVQFTRDGEEIKAIYKGDGNFIFINSGRDNCLMHVRAFGYEETDIYVDYEQLNENSPELNVFLIPSESTVRRGPVIGISGSLPSLKSVDAINLMRPLCSFAEYNQKKKILTVFGYVAGKTVKLDDTYYGIAKTDEKSYESFEVANQSGDNKAVLKNPVSEGTKPNQKIFRLLFGYVRDDGSFIFRVRDDSSDLKYLLRFKVGEDIYFRVIDFHECYGEIDLMENAEKLKEEDPPEEVGEAEKK